MDNNLSVRKNENVLESDTVNFKVDSRLLEELGERLVNSDVVALTELIKNSYDADALSCTVEYNPDKNQLSISDDGNGMSKSDFKNKWMTIATGNKEREKYSPRYKRRLTGEKGVGRFAAKFLGSSLELVSVHYNRAENRNEKLTALFDWARLRSESSIQSLEVNYEVRETSEPEGTTLTILNVSKSIAEESNLKKIKSKLMGLMTPFQAFDIDSARDLIGNEAISLEGFEFHLKGFGRDEQTGFVDNLFKQAFGEVCLELNEQSLKCTVRIKDQCNEYEFPYSNSIGCNVYSEMYFFPRRKNVFTNTGADGRIAENWVRNNSGVKVFDRGFRISPLGEENDDWLNLAIDNSTSRRTWRSALSERFFPMPEHIRRKPKDNWALYLPTNKQLVGAVFISSKYSGENEGLIPSVNREGFVKNSSYRQLQDIVRFGAELLAYHDKQYINKIETEKAEAAREIKKDELQSAIREIEKSSTLSSEDKSRIISTYQKYYNDISSLEEYDRKARKNLESMSLLGAVAGFMTHEHQSVIFNLQNIIERGRHIDDKFIQGYLDEVVKSKQSFEDYFRYTNLFIKSDKNLPERPFNIKPQIDHIIKTFGGFADDRDIDIEVKLEGDNLIETSSIPVALFSGVVLNLYSNAIKAILANKSAANGHKIRFHIFKVNNLVCVDVLDSGIGIPDEIENRIWDTLFTTTSSENNPLGSGMGIGLPLIKNIVESIKGASISLVKSELPNEFNTCFRFCFKE